MVRKSFRVTVCLDFHQVTCPGVWLCPKGKIFITVSLFKCLETTKQVKPIFPLKFHQRFIFDKIFDSVSSLGELEHEMSSRNIRMELVQVFKGKLKMVTLGVFQAALTSVLYPTVAGGSDCGAAEVDLLFESCQPFPGIIAPKAEVSTRAVIEELRLCPKFTEGPVNPTLVPSTMKYGRAKSRQRPVCHNKPSSSCTCCNGGRVVKKRPKTTGNQLPSPLAQSTKCKGIPPPRPKTIEGGNESAIESLSNGQGRDRGCPSNESDGSQSPDHRYQQLSAEEKEAVSKSDKSKHQPTPFPQQRVQADVHVDQSDNEQVYQGQGERQRNSRRSDGLQTRILNYESSPHHSQSPDEQLFNRVRKSSPTSPPKRYDQNAYKTDEIQTNLRPRGQRESDQYQPTYTKQKYDQQTHLDKGDDGKQGCDCFTCTSCKQTMTNLMVPWKVYAAPPTLEHCFCHSRIGNNKTQNEPSRSNQGAQPRNVVQSQSVTTQTSGICRCQEPNAFSTEHRSTTEKEMRNIDRNNTAGQASRPSKSENTNKKKSDSTKPQQKQAQDAQNYDSMEVKYLCPCGCIDMFSKPTEHPNKQSCGTIERRSTNLNMVNRTSIQCSTRNQANAPNLKTTAPQECTKKKPSNYHMCFCPKNKTKC